MYILHGASVIFFLDFVEMHAFYDFLYIILYNITCHQTNFYKYIIQTIHVL